jgi:hypothetical protein
MCHLHPSWMILNEGGIWKHLGGHVGQTRAAHNRPDLKQVCHLQIIIQHGGAINANSSSSGHDDNDSYSNKPTEFAQTVTFLTYGRFESRPRHRLSSLRFFVDFLRSSRKMMRRHTEPQPLLINSSFTNHSTMRWYTGRRFEVNTAVVMKSFMF